MYSEKTWSPNSSGLFSTHSRYESLLAKEEKYNKRHGSRFMIRKPIEVPVFEEGKTYTKAQLSLMADQMLRDDARSEVCRTCGGLGLETGIVKQVPQEVEDGHGNPLVVDFSELECEEGHTWFEGEGNTKGIDDKYGPAILFEEHFASRRKREIYTTVGTPDPSIVAGIYNRCVDSTTGALIPGGWRTYDELMVGDPVWAYEPKSDTYGWSPLREIFVNGAFEGMVHRYESQNISALVTEGHKWAAAHERSKDRIEEVFSTTSSAAGLSVLTPRHYIVLARDPRDQSQGEQDDLFRLLGWVITDGTYKPGRTDCVVYQAMHNPKIDSLRACLRANGVNDEPSYIDENNVGRWRIQSSVGKKLRAIAPQKLLSVVNLERHAFSEYVALFEGVLAGDGSVREQPSGYVCREVYTTKEIEAVAIQALAARIGLTTRMRRIENEAAFCPLEFAVNVKQSPWAYVRPALQPMEWYEGLVWCPRVDSGFWLARRDGRVFTTGNTHPQGRKVNSEEQRKRNGASFYA